MGSVARSLRKFQVTHKHFKSPGNSLMDSPKPGPGGPRRHGGIYRLVPVCWGEGAPCSTGPVFGFQQLRRRTVFLCRSPVPPESPESVFRRCPQHTAGSESPQQCPGCSGLGAAVSPPGLSRTWREGCLAGRGARDALPSLLASPLTAGKCSTISIISGTGPRRRKTDLLFRRGRWGL